MEQKTPAEFLTGDGKNRTQNRLATKNETFEVTFKYACADGLVLIYFFRVPPQEGLGVLSVEGHVS